MYFISHFIDKINYMVSERGGATTNGFNSCAWFILPTLLIVIESSMVTYKTKVKHGHI